MKRKRVSSQPRRRAPHVAPRRTWAAESARGASRKLAPPDPAMCERCGAVYRRKTWRAGGRTSRALLEGVRWTVCPACTQVEDQEYFGRVRITRSPGADLELEIRRRIWNVERRARHTQPERRTVRIDRVGSGIEVLTTSQELAHRIARELEKAFGGNSNFAWTDRAGSLEATWEPPAEPAGSRGRSPRRP